MSNGRFGIHGGQYIPETLMNAVIELEEAYDHYKNDPDFNAELDELYSTTTPAVPRCLYYAEKMTKDLGGAKIYLKREDLNHTGAHKINNVLGQALLAKKMGKTRAHRRDRRRAARRGHRHRGRSVWAWSARSSWASEDTERQALNVYRMRLLGATVHAGGRAAPRP